MIDIHSHILPGVDDGAPDLESALAICRGALEDGCQAIVATPHLRHEQWWNGDRSALERRFEVLRAAVDERFGGALEVRLGGEIAVHGGCLDEIDRLPEGDLLTLAGSRYLLLELPHHPVAGPDPLELIHETQVAGFRPILAHPERIRWLADDPALVHELVAQGALLQLTAMSLTGDLGRRLAEISRRWLDDGLVHFLASDAHDPALRRPGLSVARQLVARTWGDEVARALVVDHPSAVLADRPLDVRHPNDFTDDRASSAHVPAGASSEGDHGERGLARVLSFFGRGH